MTVLTATGLTKRYDGSAVVDGIDLAVERGECIGLLGPNGAGKTTTLRMLLGLTPPSGGSLEVLGFRIPEQARALRERVGVVPQTDSLDPDFPVRENLFTWASYYGEGRHAVRDRVAELLAFAGLSGREQARVTDLSGGMQRRLSLARALVNQPDLVVLDEPTTGLDPQARQFIWQSLRRLRDRGVTLMLTTHYMEEAERLCERLAIVDHGRIVAEGSPRALIAQHIEPWVLERRGPNGLQWGHDHGVELAARSEEVGDTLLLYAEDDRPLLEALGETHGIDYHGRRANLEDVFLKLTGRELRD